MICNEIGTDIQKQKYRYKIPHPRGLKEYLISLCVSLIWKSIYSASSTSLWNLALESPLARNQSINRFYCIKLLHVWILNCSLPILCFLFHHGPTSGKICHASWLLEILLSLCMEHIVFDTYHTVAACAVQKQTHLFLHLEYLNETYKVKFLFLTREL